jgi:hypothetical protein
VIDMRDDREIADALDERRLVRPDNPYRGRHAARNASTATGSSG